MSMAARLPAELLVLRHAKSAWDTDAPSDYDRPLAGRGKRDAPRIGQWLSERGLVPDHVISSPAKRAKQTVRKVLEAMHLPEALICWDERVYHAGLHTLLQVLGETPPDKQRVMLVGHNPGLEELVEHICEGAVDVPENGKVVPTGTLVWFREGQLVEIVRPRNLED